jgi:hypothetical protein
MDRKAHWDRIYSSREPASLSWYEAHLKTSCELIEQVGLPKSS